MEERIEWTHTEHDWNGEDVYEHRLFVAGGRLVRNRQRYHGGSDLPDFKDAKFVETEEALVQLAVEIKLPDAQLVSCNNGS